MSRFEDPLNVRGTLSIEGRLFVWLLKHRLSRFLFNNSILLCSYNGYAPSYTPIPAPSQQAGAGESDVRRPSRFQMITYLVIPAHSPLSPCQSPSPPPPQTLLSLVVQRRIREAVDNIVNGTVGGVPRRCSELGKSEAVIQKFCN
jgi:hypothetical protein